MKSILKPGNIAPVSAQYAVIGPKGGKTGKEIQSTKGHPLPPSDKAGSTYKIVDTVKNQSGKK